MVVRGLRGIDAGAPIPGSEDDIALLDRVEQLAPGAVRAGSASAPCVSGRVRFKTRVSSGREGRGGEPARLAGRLRHAAGAGGVCE